METKKTKRANLEKSSLLHILIGIIVALAAIFVLLEWRSQTKENRLLSDSETSLLSAMDEFSFISFDPPEPPPPPTQKASIHKMLDEQLDKEKEFFVSNTEGLDEPRSLSFLPVFLLEEEEEEFTPSSYEIIEIENEYEIPVRLLIEEDEWEYEPHIDFVESLPEFPGGDRAMYEFLYKSIRYPTLAIEMGIHGRVVCSFIVDKSGTVTNVEVLFTSDPILSKEAIRLISSMPQWKPAKYRGRAIPVKYVIPVIFRLPS